MAARRVYSEEESRDEQARTHARKDMIRRTHLATGLVLFVFVWTHLANHALGLISLQAMEDGRVWFLAVWRGPAGSAVLILSLLVHMLLAAWALYSRRTLRMRASEAVQLLLGFSVPVLLAGHLVGTRAAHELFGTDDSYLYVLYAQWKLFGASVYWQTAGLYAAWLHGCTGLYFWLRLKPGFSVWRQPAFAFALLVPVVAWLGYYAGGKEVLALAERSPEAFQMALRSLHPPDPKAFESMSDLVFAIRAFAIGLIAVALAGRLMRNQWHRGKLIRVAYPDGRSARIDRGFSLLDASRLHGIPHASVCGGRGRCSTCRVRIVEGAENLSPPSPEESRVLKRVEAPPRVRLACQARPAGDVSVVPLLPANVSIASIQGRRRAGQEREIAILFADLRSFTRFSEKKLPYDVVFVLNRYFTHMGQAVEETGGHLDKFIGDGVMALFGIGGGIEGAARDALAAARLMSVKLADLNSQLANELDEPLRIGIGIHAGPAIIGDMGYGSAVGLTAVGDSVNTASRLESLTKDLGAQLVFSHAVAVLSGIDTGELPAHDVLVRGRADPLRVFSIEDASTLKLLP